ncbi:MAG: tyrosine recombinase XerC, partial [Parahaliea sp.]
MSATGEPQDALSTTTNAFLDYLRDVRRLSPHTLAAYRRDLQSLADWCQRRGHHTPHNLSDVNIRGWVGHLRQRGLSGGSIQRALSAARTWLGFLVRQGELEHNPATTVRAPRTPRKLPRALDVDQTASLLESGGDDGPLSLRDHAMAELFYSCGLRLAELVAANIEDYDRAAALITVTGKGNKTRTLPVGSVAAAALQQWLTLRPPAAEEREGAHPLFTSGRGRRIGQRSVQSRLRLLGHRAGLPRNVHPHMLRHSFASHLLESSGDLR